MPTTAQNHPQHQHHHQDTPLSDYFMTMDDPLHVNDPFYAAWDADLSPEEYGDQSGMANGDDQASFSSHEDNDRDQSEDEDEDDWNIVYAASFAVVASTSNKNPTRKRRPFPSAVVVQPSAPLRTMTRRDAKVRFCESPPKVNCYETCSREEYSELYYSVHELQKIIDDLRQETNNTNGNNIKGKTHVTSKNKTLTAGAPTRSS
jgi:hypothetical protein